MSHTVSLVVGAVHGEVGAETVRVGSLVVLVVGGRLHFKLLQIVNININTNSHKIVRSEASPPPYDWGLVLTLTLATCSAGRISLSTISAFLGVSRRRRLSFWRRRRSLLLTFFTVIKLFLSKIKSLLSVYI